jgi:hypothetical protein
MSECFDLIYRRFPWRTLWIWEGGVFLEWRVEGRCWSTFFTSASGIANWINPARYGYTFRVKFLCQIIRPFLHFAKILPGGDTVVALAASAFQSVLHPESTECSRLITVLVEWWKCSFVQEIWHLPEHILGVIPQKFSKEVFNPHL